MEYPTFGGDDGKLQLCVQSLDRKGEVTQGNDRLKVLINRAPKRHRSITALNFFACPQNAQAPPVPPMPMPVATKRPLPRFLEVFTPLNAYETTDVSSSVSTPSTSRSSLPVTPASPQRQLSADVARDPSSSYFPLLTAQQKVQAETLIGDSRGDPQHHQDFAEVLPSNGSQGEDWLEPHQFVSAFQETTRSDRSFEWAAMRADHRENTLMMDGTFGRA